MSAKWSSEDDEILIDFVRIHEALYNIKCKDYRKTQLKRKMWCDIGTMLNKRDSDCYKRWCYVRDYYIRRKGKPGTGSSGEAAKKRSDLLSFLDSLPRSQRTSITSIVEDVNLEDGSEILENTRAVNEDRNITHCEELEDMTGISSNDDSEDDNNKKDRMKERERQEINNKDNVRRGKKRKNSTNSEKRLNLLKQIAQRKTFNQNELDETDLFFSSMAKILKKLPRYEQVQLRMQIGSLVGNAELRCMSKDSPKVDE